MKYLLSVKSDKNDKIKNVDIRKEQHRIYIELNRKTVFKLVGTATKNEQFNTG